MNDDFLYRLRTEPSPVFAASLKARLDRLPSRRVYIVRIGIGALLFGTALAMGLPGVRQSIFSLFAQPAPVENIAPQLQSLVTEPSDANEPSDEVDVAGLNDAITSELEPVPELFAEKQATGGGKRPEENPEPNSSASNLVDESTDAEARLLSEPSSADAQSEFIVTGPLMYEAGTPSGAIVIRTSLFKAITWSMKPLTDMLRDKRAFDPEIATTSARRLEQLALMIPDAFEHDTRGANADSRSRNDIWARPADFQLMANQLTRAAGELNAAVYSGDRRIILRAAARVGMACNACHDAFVKFGASSLPLP
jgi:cytochrome c556